MFLTQAILASQMPIFDTFNDLDETDAPNWWARRCAPLRHHTSYVLRLNVDDLALISLSHILEVRWYMLNYSD